MIKHVGNGCNFSRGIKNENNKVMKENTYTDSDPLLDLDNEVGPEKLEVAQDPPVPCS